MAEGSRSPTDPRPRTALGQYASGSSLDAKQMNRAYGFRMSTLRALLGRRRNAAGVAASPQDIDRMATLAASAQHELIELERYGLGYTPENYGGMCSPGETSKVRFPRLCIEGTEAVPLPKTGRAVIDYRVCAAGMRDDYEGKERHSTDIEVKSIEPIDDDDEEEDDDETTDLPGKAKQLAARCDRLLGFQTATLPQRKPNLIELRSTLTPEKRRQLALFLRAGRMKGRAVYPRASQRAVNAVAKVFAEKHASLGARLDRLVAFSANLATVELDGEPIRARRFIQKGGYTRLVQSDGRMTIIGDAPGTKNFIRRHKVATAAVGGALVGANVVAARSLLRDFRAAGKAKNGIKLPTPKWVAGVTRGIMRVVDRKK